MLYRKDFFKYSEIILKFSPLLRSLTKQFLIETKHIHMYSYGYLFVK